jgi:hypothetical protein
MKLILPLIGLFIFIGLTQSAITRRIYVWTIALILLVSLYFYFTSP